MYDFQAMRGLARWCQGAPAVWLYRDDQDPLTQEPVAAFGPPPSQAVDLDAVTAAIPNCRVADLSLSPDPPVAGQPLTITVALTDLDRNPITGEEVTLWTPWTGYIATSGLQAVVTSQQPGEYEIEVWRHADPSKLMASVRRTVAVIGADV